MKQQLTKHNQ